jgi:rSAM/selenodomain-associated transferase 1
MRGKPTPGLAGTLICFAREPVAGQVKTRLIPALGAEGAARLYRVLLDLALRAGAELPGVERELWCTGAIPGGGRCAELADRYGLALRHQPEGDLGERMESALTETLARAGPAVLIGSDCPEYSPDYLASAFTVLETADAVLGPAADGGYVLIGLRRPTPALFAHIPWGTGLVLERTRAALRGLGWRWAELPTLRDLDEPEDLRAFPEFADAARGLADT